jgi:hypothetical protein
VIETTDDETEGISMISKLDTEASERGLFVSLRAALIDGSEHIHQIATRAFHATPPLK